MTPQRAAELLPIITAFSQGKTIQFLANASVPNSSYWENVLTPSWQNDIEYRLKPEPREVFIVEKGGLLTLECHSQFSHCCRQGERLVHFREVV